VDRLLHKTRSSQLPDIENSSELADNISEFFVGKVQKIRDGLATLQQGVEKETSNEIIQVPQLESFPAISADDLKKIILKAPTKSCQLDPIPTNILKECIEPLLPILLKIINSSLASSTVPTTFKKAIVTPLLKKPSLDRNVLKNYRPVSNLSFLSKILEKVVSKFLTTHRTDHDLHVPLQSAYRQFHSTETALLKVHNDVLRALDRGECVFLVLLDLSAAFDTVDHSVLRDRMQQEFGITGGALSWLLSYMTDRHQAVMVRGVESEDKVLQYGVPQGSVLGPELFKDYIAPLANLIRSHRIDFHGYADDTQLYATFVPGEDERQVLDRMQRCIAAVKDWMALNWLKLNDDKTEFMVLGSPCNLAKTSTEHIVVGDHKIAKSQHVRNIGAMFDSTASMEVQVIRTSQSAWHHLFTISKIRPYLTIEQTKSVIHAYVTSRLDQNNSLLSGVPAYLLYRLQKVQNAAARIIFGRDRGEHVTDLLKELHWLPLSQRYIFKIYLLVYKALNDEGPSYLKSLLTPKSCPRELRSSSENLLDVPRTRVKYGDRAFSVLGPRLWNDLPSDIRMCSTTSSFKSSLKTHLFKQPYKTK